MLDRLTIAGFFVVAWVKCWSLQTLLSVIDGNKKDSLEDRVSMAHAVWSFLPGDVRFYLNEEITARHWMAFAAPELDGKLRVIYESR